MRADIYFLLAAAMVICTAVPAFMATRWIAPLAIALSALVGYFGLDLVLGTAKPAKGVPGWSRPHKGIVIGGKLDGLYLLIDETSGPRLYQFAEDPDMRRRLKQAMQKHADANQGNPWGFEIKDGSPADGATSQGAGKAGNGTAKATGSSTEDRPPTIQFAEPQRDPGVPKDMQQEPAQ